MISFLNTAHGEAGVKFIDGARAKLGLPAEKWYVSPETRVSKNMATITHGVLQEKK